jgi:hypothetical protein
MSQPKGHGLIIEPLTPTDYVSGDGKLSGAVINPEGDWTPYVIDHEKQAPKFETNACASFGTVDAAQALLKHFNSTVANLSDRFLAKVSNTDPNKGNSPQKVAQAFRDNWSCLEAEWSMDDAKDVADYYKPIPANTFAQALARKGKHEFTYHAIKNPTAAKIREELKRGTVCMSVPAWAVDENGHYYRPKGWSDNHWVWVLYVDENGLYKVKDTYEPFFKTIVAEHIPEAAYRYNINEEAVDGILTKLASIIKNLIAYIKAKPEEPKPEPKPLTNPEKLHAAALSFIGKDASPNDLAPDELGCAETVNAIYKSVFGAEIGGSISTYRLYAALKTHPNFTKVTKPLAGDIVISPTGYGGKNGITNGHCGIVSNNGDILSNDSRTGKFEKNYTIASWSKRYAEKGGYPVHFYRRS